MTRTAHGFLHAQYGKDMDGTGKTFEWIEDRPQTFGMSEAELAAYQAENGEEIAGWFAMCEVEPEAGWVGPFSTEAEAIHAATNEDALFAFLHAQDVMGMHMGENA